MNFAVLALGHGSIDESAIGRAIDNARNRREMASVSIVVQENGQLNFVPAATKASFKATNGDWKTLLGADLIEPFAELAPLWRVVLYKDLEAWALAVIFHHSIADGRSAMCFLKDFLEDLDHAPGNQIQTRTIMSDVFSDAKREGTAPAGKKTQALPWFSKRTAPPTPALLSFALSQSESQKLLQAARANGVTVHGWIAASQLLATNAMFETQEERQLGISTPIDYRKYVNTADIDSLWFCISLITSTLAVDGSRFLDVAREVSNDIKEQVLAGQGLRFYDSLPEPAQLISKPDGIKLFTLLMQRLPQASVLSNVGIVQEPDLQNLKVDRICFTVHPTIAQPIFVTATTYKDELNFVLNYDSNRWPRKIAERFANEFRQNLTLPRQRVESQNP